MQKEYDELKTQEAIFTLNKMAHLTGISSDIFETSTSSQSECSTPGELEEEGGGVLVWSSLI